ncbi:galactose mutarotase [Aliigemmobacter aestuarii]|uniref:Galactose mutarotase n=1 Tax=Aliigemmobacter aestuarii TaxID=1445661 RepID=A0A4S3MNZ0_9RHOB|nr:aldose epimerase family protein [Gemmobacter aestuarii]THD83435.1 galactose mutarotase [Gemmobacter aestuarii]
MASITAFGTTLQGEAVQAIRLAAGGLEVRLLTLGSILQAVRIDGHGHNLTTGFDTVEAYQKSTGWHGALVGPVANRIAGASARIAGRDCRFPANEAGITTLHSGAAGIDRKIWTIVEAAADSLTLAVTLPEGEGGFPGHRQITARWCILPPATLRLDLTATTDAPTILNLANHSYWNLDGTASWAGHSLRIAADAVLPVDDRGIPTGEVCPVGAMGLDFRTPRFARPGAPALDHNFCLSERRMPLRAMATLTGAKGIAMEIATTEPGLQVYDGRHPRPGAAPYEALALEPQFWPDAPHHPGFPLIDLAPGQPWRQITEWRFSTP